jgi:hypothetical protein
MVGDALSLDVTVSGVPAGAVVIPPDTDKGFGDFTVLAWEGAPALNAKGKAKVRDSSRYQYRYGIATYKPQNCTIPSLRFLVGAAGAGNGGVINNGGTGNAVNNNDSDNTGNNRAGAPAAGFSVNAVNNAAVYDTLATAPIPIRMLSALPPSPPDSGDFALKDLKAQQGAGKAGLWYLWVISGAAIAVAAFMIIRKRLGKKGGVEAAPPVCLLPPYEEAMGAIDALEGKKYLARGMVREHVFELSEIFKRYIGRRYDTIAPELTTEEIAAWLEFSGISREMRMCAERFFRSGDQVKFAKWVPDRPCVDGYMKDVLMFIEATKPDTALPYERKTERMGVAQ